MSTSMPAVVDLELAPGACELRERPVPEIGPDDVLLQVGAVGVCGSDVHQYHNSHSWGVNVPVVLGHEFSGIIARAGERVVGFAEGDRVAVRYSMSGTHLGEFQGVAPTLKRVSGTGINSYRFEESRIVEEWWQGDILVLLQQMDAAPSSIRIGF